MDKMGQHFHKIEAVRLEGGDPPSPPQAVSLTAFFPFFFTPSLRILIKIAQIALYEFLAPLAVLL